MNMHVVEVCSFSKLSDIFLLALKFTGQDAHCHFQHRSEFNEFLARKLVKRFGMPSQNDHEPAF